MFRQNQRSIVMQNDTVKRLLEIEMKQPYESQVDSNDPIEMRIMSRSMILRQIHSNKLDDIVEQMREMHCMK